MTTAAQTLVSQPTYQSSNIIHLVPQIVYQAQPVQYQVLIPVQPQHIACQRSAEFAHEDEYDLHHHHEHGCCSELKKQSGDCLLSYRNVSAANTAASHGCESELGEVEIEIPGGFENILENDMSNSDFDESSEYVSLPKI